MAVILDYQLQITNYKLPITNVKPSFAIDHAAIRADFVWGFFLLPENDLCGFSFGGLAYLFRGLAVGSGKRCWQSMVEFFYFTGLDVRVNYRLYRFTGQ